MRWRLLATGSALVAILAALLVMEHAIWEATDWEFALSVGLLSTGGALALFLLSGPEAEMPEPVDRSASRMGGQATPSDTPSPIGRRSHAPQRSDGVQARSVLLVVLLLISAAALAVGWRHGLNPQNAGAVGDLTAH